MVKKGINCYLWTTTEPDRTWTICSFFHHLGKQIWKPLKIPSGVYPTLWERWQQAVRSKEDHQILLNYYRDFSPHIVNDKSKGKKKNVLKVWHTSTDKICTNQTAQLYLSDPYKRSITLSIWFWKNDFPDPNLPNNTVLSLWVEYINQASQKCGIVTDIKAIKSIKVQFFDTCDF